MKQLRAVELKRFLRKNKPLMVHEIVLVLENIQYARNVASMFRIADAFGVQEIYLTSTSHTPPFGKDLKKVSRSKEEKVQWKYFESSGLIINKLKTQGFEIIALEITDVSKNIYDLRSLPKKFAIVAGSEAHGISPSTLARCDSSIFIPMQGSGASLNVSSSVAVSLGIARSLGHNR